jgi:hypothetical protein
VEEKDLIPEIAPYVKIKFPTADSDRGLGTGEFDETIGVDLSKRPIERLYGDPAFGRVRLPRGRDGDLAGPVGPRRAPRRRGLSAGLSLRF